MVAIAVFQPLSGMAPWAPRAGRPQLSQRGLLEKRQVAKAGNLGLRPRLLAEIRPALLTGWRVGGKDDLLPVAGNKVRWARREGFAVDTLDLFDLMARRHGQVDCLRRL